MKKITALILMCFICSPVLSATIYKSGNSYGLKDDSGQIILAPKYQQIEQLSYTPSKRVIIPMHAMDEAEVKKLNTYKIKQNNLWGAANSKGKVIYECKYKNVTTDSNGDIVLTSTDGKEIYPHPVVNAAKAGRDTITTIVGLPVTILGAVMIPIEAVSKGTGNRSNKQ